MENNTEKELGTGNYMYGNFIGSMIFLTGLTGWILTSIDIHAWLFWLAFFAVITLSIYVCAYFFFNRSVFYVNRIERRYLFKHHGKKFEVILNKDIMDIKYIYIGGRGGGSDGRLKVRYMRGEGDRVLNCPMDHETAAKICLELRKQNFKIIIKPPDVLSSYGFPPRDG